MDSGGLERPLARGEVRPRPCATHYDDFNDFMRRNIASAKVLAGQPEAFAHPARPVGSAAPPATRPASPSPRETSVECPAGQSIQPAIFESRLNEAARRLRPRCLK